jgi:polysaccharide biosynthesis/export protein
VFINAVVEARGILKMHRSWWVITAFSGCLLLSACASSPETPLAVDLAAKNPQVSAYGSSEEYRMGPGDLLRIDVFQAEQLSRKARVSLQGDISLPLIGTLHAAGLTSQQLETLLAQKLKDRYLQDPQVSVFIEEFTSQRVTIEGQVKKPGVYSLTGGNATLLQMIATAGGPEQIAATKKVQLFRVNADGTKETRFFDIEAIRDGQMADPPVQGNDVIVMHKDGLKSFAKGFTDALRGLIYLSAPLPIF